MRLRSADRAGTRTGVGETGAGTECATAGTPAEGAPGRPRRTATHARSERRPPVRVGSALLLAAVLALFGTLSGPAAQAHITGVFLYFLKDVQGTSAQSSTDIIRAQLDETNERIQGLAPQIAAAQARYDELRDAARLKVQFYSRYAGEAFATVLFGGDDPLEVLANAALLRHTVARDLRQLQETAQVLDELRAKQRELEGYRDVLSAFAEAETRHDKVLAGRSTHEQEVALYDVSESWEQIRAGPLADYFAWADQRLAARDGLRAVAVRGGGGTQAASSEVVRWTVSEDDLQSLIGVDAGSGRPPVDGVDSLRVFLRADHVYIVGTFTVPLGTRQVILLGQLARDGAFQARYQVEYALVDGYLIDPSDPQMRELAGDRSLLRIDGRWLSEDLSLLQFEQDNQGLILYTRR